MIAPPFQSILLKKAIIKLETALLKNSEDSKTIEALANLLETLADLYRRQGNLAESAKVYQRLSQISPTHPTGSYLHTILSRKSLPSSFSLKNSPLSLENSPPLPPESCYWPAPFIRFDQVLPQELYQRLFPYLQEHQKEFRYARMGEESIVDLTYRTTLRASVPREIKDWFKNYMYQTIPQIFPCLSLSPFPIGRIEVKFLIYLNGHFFKIHQDREEGADLRKINFTYYFHQSPKPFQGGDILLHDTDLKTNTSLGTHFTQLSPIDNQLLIFPAVYFHEVTRVSCSQNTLEHARLAIVGHISSRN